MPYAPENEVKSRGRSDAQPILGAHLWTWNRQVLDPEPNDISDLAVVDTLLDRGHQHNVQLGLAKAVERLQFDVNQVSSPDGLMGLGREAIELEIDGRADVGRTGQEAVVSGDANAVGVEHHHGDALVECHAQHRRTDTFVPI